MSRQEPLEIVARSPAEKQRRPLSGSKRARASVVAAGVDQQLQPLRAG